MTSTYVYNEACACDWCSNQGRVPQGTASNGHSFGYETPHIPPAIVSLRFGKTSDRTRVF